MGKQQRIDFKGKGYLSDGYRYEGIAMKPFQYMQSANGNYTLEMQMDGNLVIYVTKQNLLS